MTKQLELLAELKNLPHFMAFVCEEAREQGFSPQRRQEIELVLEEALVNIIEYAYPSKQLGSLTLHLKGAVKDQLRLEIRDRGVLFNPLERIDPDREADLMERPIGGLGIILMKELTDDMTWQRKNGENCLSIIFEPRHDQ